MPQPLKVVQFGMGAIGQGVVRYLLHRKEVVLVGAIDHSPLLIGRDIGDILGLQKPTGIKVGADADDILGSSDGQVVILTTTSRLPRLEDQLRLCLSYGKNVISSAEELIYPWAKYPALARSLDEAARAAGVTLLGTGVNPGFVMDTLPIHLSGVCSHVESIRVQRHQNASLRRLSFLVKIGAGLSPVVFEEKVAEHQLGHLGFAESMQMIAASLGWHLERTDEIIVPHIATMDMQCPAMRVATGQVAGICQTATGYTRDKAVITLELQAWLDHPSPTDSVSIDGDPPLHSKIRGGVHGDTATCAILANALPRVVHAPPGLKTMPELGLVSCVAG